MASSDSLISNLPSTLFRQKGLYLSIFGGVLLLTILYLLVVKRQYSSSMTIAVENTRSTLVVSSGNAAPQSSGGSADQVETQVNSEIELLTSDDILQHLVTFRSTLRPNEPAPAPGSEDMSGATAKLAKRIEITPVRKSAIIDVVYRDYTPQLAQAVLQELEKEYLKKHVGLQRAVGASEFFARETTSATRDRQRAEQDLSDFQASNGFVSLSREKDLLAANLDRIKDSVLQDSVDLSSNQHQVSDLKQQLAHTPRRIATVQRTAPNQYVLQQLVSQVTDLRNRRITLSERFVPTDRVMQEITAQLANTQATLDDITKHPTVENSEDNNPSWMSLDLQLKEQQVTLASVAARLAEHQRQAKEFGDRLVHLQQITATNDALEQQAQEATTNQLSLTAKLDAAKVDDLLDVGRFGNVAIALAPTFSQAKVKPIVPLTLILGILTAIVMCLAVAVLKESSRETMFTPEELESNAKLPVLATIPETDALYSLIRLDVRRPVAATQ